MSLDGYRITMKKRILFINPWLCDFAAYDLWAKPLGLLYLASLFRKNGFDVNYIDCLNPYHPEIRSEPHIKQPKRKSTGAGKFPKEIIPPPQPLQGIRKRYSRYGISPRIFVKELSRLKRPDVILVTSMMTYWYTGVFETITVLKDIFPDVPVVLGGNYATLCTEHALRCSGADMVVEGEGEASIGHVTKTFLNDDLSFMPDRNSLDTYPYPAFDLLPQNDHVPIMTSRGCPFRCIYCASHLLNDGFRVRDPISVVDEIEFWHKRYGIANFAFYDDALLVNPEERAIPMLREIIRRNMDCQFHCPNGLHLRGMSEKLSSLLFHARFRTIRFGFETSDVQRQVETGGKITNDETRQAIAYLKSAGYSTDTIGVYILCGLPYQTADEVRHSISFVKSCGAKPIIAEFSPIPGTAIWHDAVDTSPYEITQEPLFHNNTLLPCRGEHFSYEMYEELKMLTRMR